jgi:pantothenate kinase
MSYAPGGLPVMTTFSELLERARGRLAAGERRIIGVVGTPGAGKTTLVEAVIQALAATSDKTDGWLAHVPMDGFHLADVELERLGRRDRKGAPDTFDANGYATLLHRIHSTCGTGETVYAPAFDRDIEQPVAGTIPVLPHCELVLTEGNYLLLDDEDWGHVRAELDEVWFLDADDEVRRSRLVRRHIQFGKAPSHAEAWVAEVDEPNAKLIAASRDSADVLVSGVLLPNPPTSTPRSTPPSTPRSNLTNLPT